MIELITSRLKLIPLELDDLKLPIDNLPSLEKKLGLNHCEIQLWMYEFFARTYAYLSSLDNWKAVYIWYTPWLIILPEDKRIIGIIHFHGKPNEKLEVEIGEFFWKSYRNKGYGSEATKKFIDFAFNETEIKTVTCRIMKFKSNSLEPNPYCQACQHMFEKVGMKKVYDTEKYVLLKMSKPD